MVTRAEESYVTACLLALDKLGTVIPLSGGRFEDLDLTRLHFAKGRHKEVLHIVNGPLAGGCVVCALLYSMTACRWTSLGGWCYTTYQ